MSENEFNEMDELMELLLETPAGPERDRRMAGLNDEQRAAFARLLALDDLVWESSHGAPPLEVGSGCCDARSRTGFRIPIGLHCVHPVVLT